MPLAGDPSGGARRLGVEGEEHRRFFPLASNVGDRAFVGASASRDPLWLRVAPLRDSARPGFAQEVRPVEPEVVPSGPEGS